MHHIYVKPSTRAFENYLLDVRTHLSSHSARFKSIFQRHPSW